MKKTGSKRTPGMDNGPGSAVLDAPETSYAPDPNRSYAPETNRSYAPETNRCYAADVGTQLPWQGRGAAPAGALQRGFGAKGYGDDGVDEAGPGYGADEPEYVPRRGALRVGWRGLPKSVFGRILFGLAVVAVIGAIGGAVAALRQSMLHDPRFVLGTTDDIQVEGAEHLTRDQVLNVFGSDLERNIFRISLGERKADLERLPWVEHAAMMRLLPDHLRVLITERTPVAFVRQGTQIGLVDASGVLLDMPADAAGDPHYSFPVLTGLSASQTWQARAERMQLYRRFMTALGSAGPQVTDSLSEVDVTDAEDVKALMAAGSSDVMVHFGNEDFLKRYREFEQHLPEWKQQYPKLASADMRYEGQVVLEMQGGGGTEAAVANVPVAPSAAAAKGSSRIPSGRTDRKTAAETMAVGPADAVTEKSSGVKSPAVKAAVKTPVARRSMARKRSVRRRSAANERVFAALAAAHKAEMQKAAASAGRTPPGR